MSDHRDRVPTAPTPRRAAIERLARGLSEMDVQVETFETEQNGRTVRVEIGVDEPEADAVSGEVNRVILAYHATSDHCERVPSVCDIVATSPGEDTTLTFEVRRDWLPEDPVDETDEGDARELLERVEETVEVA